MRAVVQRHDTDAIISDSLTRFGVRGNGTPEETRDFIACLTELGLGRDLAFLLLHHPLTRPDASLQELEQIAGAWGPHADAILMLRRLTGNRARVSFPKPPRWARGTPRPRILRFDPATEAFTLLEFEDEEGDERDYLDEITRFLSHRSVLPPKEAWRTAKEIADKHDQRFISRTGGAAKEVDRHPSATVWQLADGVTRAAESPESPTPVGEGHGKGDLVTQTFKSHQVTESPHPDSTIGPDSPDSSESASAVETLWPYPAEPGEAGLLRDAQSFVDAVLGAEWVEEATS